MTPDQLIEQCRLAIRWAESVKAGKAIEIQCLARGAETWATAARPNWDFINYEYREKPRPKEAWFVVPHNPMPDRESAEVTAAKYGGTIIHMREVVE